jgi:predicted TIM-barrel fold metal-dependent hydrolase|tara:strand:+ start:2724 stop:3890 length:1167 start_codon:yes stop_codon:yes gene_type:complete
MKPISADSHVVEGPEVFVGLSDRFGDDAPRIMDTETEVDAIVIPAKGVRGAGAARLGLAGMRLRPGNTVTRRAGHKPEVDNLTSPDMKDLISKGFDGLRPGIVDGSRRHEDQDVDGLELECLYPGFFGMFSFSNYDLLTACQKNYNDWLYDYCAASNGRLYGLAAIPMQKPQAALVELERVIKRGFVGGCIPCTSPVDYPYNHEIYEPIWALAEESNFPLSMHVGTNSYLPPEYRNRQAIRDGVADYSVSPTTIQRTLVELICRGVAEKHPKLQFVVAEFNGGWIAHWLDRLDQGLSREWRFREESAVKTRPHEIWARQFFATIEDDRPALLTRNLIGTDNLMWGSDYPHSDSTFPCSIEVLDELFVDISNEEREKITRDNCKRLYGI